MPANQEPTEDGIEQSMASSAGGKGPVTTGPKLPVEGKGGKASLLRTFGIAVLVFVVLPALLMWLVSFIE